jgi:tetratricopeptide (TPR) repeat protein
MGLRKLATFHMMLLTSGNTSRKKPGNRVTLEAYESDPAAMNTLFLALLFALHPLEKKGIDELYNLEFAAAASTFGALSREEPSSPAGPHYLASLIWMEELTRRGAMMGETFQSSRYWTRTKKEPPSPEMKKKFEAQVAETKRRAENILSANGDDVEALYFLGATEGAVGAFEATLNRSYFAAYRAGRRARKKHQRLKEIAPDLADAYLMLGTYEYALATLPRSVKVLTFLIGARGSKDKGFELVRKAAGGKRTYWGARLLLTVMDTREKRYTRALGYLRELEAAFPRNPLFPVEQGWVHLLSKNWTAARRIFEKVRAKQQLDIAHYEKVPTSLLLLRLGESYLFAGRFQDAVDRFDEAQVVSDITATTQALIHRRRGQAYDGLNRRKDAVAEYQTTIRLNMDKASRRQAKRHLKKPFSLTP